MQDRNTGRPQNQGRRPEKPRDESLGPELTERMISLDRVARVVKGGRRFRFRAVVVVGDGKGTVGVGVGKGRDVASAIQKATAVGRKDMFTVQLNNTTINHETTVKFGGARVFMKPAPEGTGVIAGGAVRSVLEVVGVRDIFTKSLGSTNKINNAYATMAALRSLQVDDAATLDAKKAKEVAKSEVTEVAAKPKKETVK